MTLLNVLENSEGTLSQGGVPGIGALTARWAEIADEKQ